MKERPILFSGPMVRAILAGTKTQTRRVAPIASLDIRHHDREIVTWGVKFSKPVKGAISSHSGGKLTEDQARNVIGSMFCPYGAPGDRLWVRETWGDCTPGADALSGTHYDTPWYRADADSHGLLGHDGVGPVYVEDIKWRPSIHMPRWASRITLEITAVRVERLQDISAEDAMAEGVEIWRNAETFKGLAACSAHHYEFEDMWTHINGPGSWDANPWVWVIEFRRVGR